jgi:hypothetical protein
MNKILSEFTGIVQRLHPLTLRQASAPAQHEVEAGRTASV